MRGAGRTAVDLAIVGNGALGCALALRFAEEHPTARVALIGPRRRPGSASLAAAAMLGAFAEIDATTLAGTSARAKLALAIQASRLWPGHLALLNRRLGGLGYSVPPIAVELGTSVLCRGRPGSLGAATFDAIAQALDAHGEPFARVDTASIDGVAPGGAVDRPRALRIPGEGRVNAPALLRAYDAAFAGSACVEVVDAEVFGIEVDAAGADKVLVTAGGPIRARRVVIAAGARSQDLIDGLDLGARIPRLVAGVGVALVLRLDGPSSPGPRPREVLRCIGDEPAGGPYVVPYGPDRLYVGATNDVMEIGTATPPPAAAARLLEAAARHVHPRLRELPIEETLVGWRPTTLDTYPLLGPTSIEGIWLASGTRRDGFHLSPLIAAELTRCLSSTTRTTEALPFGGHFAPERRLLLELPKAIAVERTIAHSLERGDATSPDRAELERDVLAVYDAIGLPDGDVGIPPELFEMYRRGLAAPNLAG